MKNRVLIIVCGFLLTIQMNAQIITSDPVFPVDDQAVTIYYDASLGNQGLLDYGGDVYAHTGVLTDQSSSPSNWRYVKTDWGENTAETKLTRLSDNLYSLDITPSIREYYGVPEGESITDLAFVFRSSDNSREGKGEGNSDIFLEVFEPVLSLKIISPEDRSSMVDLGEEFELNVSAQEADTLAVYLNDEFFAGAGTEGNILTLLPTDEIGVSNVFIWASDGDNDLFDSISYFVKGDPIVAPLPEGVEDGINYLSENTVILSFYAPGKESVIAVGDFSDWQFRQEYFMNITPDAQRFWIEINDLDPAELYRFYYLVDHGYDGAAYTHFADPYTELLLDPANDAWISESTFPGIGDLIEGLEPDPYSVIKTDRTPYAWKEIAFTPPAQSELVVYEILLRDFLGAHDWETLTDTLDYLENLGVNALQLMPFNEFNGNESWGYNPTYFFAPDKYYGPPEDLKAFVDECHIRGMAVIQDIVFNHVEYGSYYAGLYMNSQGMPSSENPWLNEDVDPGLNGYQAIHPYNVFLDFDHSSEQTKYLIDRSTAYWMEEYKIDGFRFDLTKGFTTRNTYTGGGNYNEGETSAYDADRIATLKRMADEIWSVNENAYVILEHFCDNSEEKELANYGMMLWGNLNYNYNEGTMGYNEGGKSNFGGISYKNRGWNDPHLVGYMESHDEERLMFKNLEYGNIAGSYSIKDLSTALERIELAATFFFTVPGPKMIWQFGELGYDISIEQNGRTGNKPILWNYYDEPDRKRLYDVFSALVELKTSEPAMATSDFNMNVAGAVKRIELNHADMDIRVIGNFDVVTQSADPNFSKTGTWYELFSGEEMNVSDSNEPVSLGPGEYRLYTSKNTGISVNLSPRNLISSNDNFTVYPVPADDQLFMKSSHNLRQIDVFDLNGRKVLSANSSSDFEVLNISELSPGIYVLRAYDDMNSNFLRKFVKK